MDAYCSWDDTIVALATAQGVSAIGVIRLSGHRAIEIVDLMFPAKDLRQQPANTLHVGYLKDGEIMLDEVVLSFYRIAKSYFGPLFMGALYFNPAPIQQNTKNDYFQVLEPVQA